MENMIKRFLSLALALIMVIGLMPTSFAFAAETDDASVVTEPSDNSTGSSSEVSEDEGDIDAQNDSAEMVAQIGDNKYESLQAAVNAAEDGDVVNVIASHEVTCTSMWFAVAGKTITVDLNGKVIKVTDARDFKELIRVNSGSLTLKDSSTAQTGKIDVISENGLYNLLYAEDGATLIIESGSYCLDKSLNEGALINARADENVTVNGGHLSWVILVPAAMDPPGSSMLPVRIRKTSSSMVVPSMRIFSISIIPLRWQHPRSVL